jgi:hypothetical protein
MPANTYPNQPAALTKIGYAAHLIVSCKLPEDRVYTMLKTVAEHVKDLAAVNKAMENMTVKEMGEDIGVPFHPGAKRYYNEVGVKM